MSAAQLKRVFRVLVFATWAQRMVWCQYYAEELGDGRGHHEQEQHEDHYVKPLYKFGYWVHDPKTKDVKNHWEHRDGDVVHGAYSLLQPDGHVRVVEYTADKRNGFNAHVKYMYEGRSPDGDEGGANDIGASFNQHLEDESVRLSQVNDVGDGRGGGGRPKQHPLSDFYKKHRNGKPGGPAGHYNRKPNPFDGRPKHAGGNDLKKQRLPSAPEKSTEHFTNGGLGFDAFSQFSSPASAGGGANSERYHGSPPSGGNLQYDDQGTYSPSEHFSRKYSTLSTPASPEKAIRYTGGIQPLSSKHEPIYSHRRPDAASAASSEHSNRREPSEKQQQLPETPREPQKYLNQQHQQQQSPQERHEPHYQQRPLRSPSYRWQRSHNSEHGASRDDGGGDDDDDDPQQVPQYNDGIAKTGGGDDDDDESRPQGQSDAKSRVDVDVQKQPLREFHFEEPPYPFEVPENVRMSVKYRAPTRKRDTPPRPARRLATVSSSHFPSWYGTETERFRFGERPVFYY